MTESEQITAFLAARGATKIAAGVSQTGYTKRDWRHKVRGEPTEQELIDQRIVVGDHVRNGLGEWIA